jgi:hypothetical protein
VKSRDRLLKSFSPKPSGGVPAVVVGGGGLGKRSSVSVGWEELGCEEGSFKCLVHTLIAALLLSNVLVTCEDVLLVATATNMLHTGGSSINFNASIW